MRVLLLTNNNVSLPLADWLREQGETVTVWQEKLTPELIDAEQPNWVVSYNYKYMIRQWLLDRLPHRVVNLHISLLPWNRGSDPNLWSFIEDSPKGVTIHEVDAGLDTGDVLLQQELHFDETAVTLGESYNHLQQAIQQLFRDNWGRMRVGRIAPKPQSGSPTAHKRADLSPYLWVLQQHGYGITAARFKQLIQSPQPINL